MEGGRGANMDHIVSLVAKKHQTSRRDNGKPGESKEFEAIASSCRNAFCNTGALSSRGLAEPEAKYVHHASCLLVDDLALVLCKRPMQEPAGRCSLHFVPVA